MRKKLIIPAVVATIFLTGCSATGLDAIQADVELLKREVADLKSQLGIANNNDYSSTSDNSTTETTPSSSENSGKVNNGTSQLGVPFVVDGITYTVTERERTTQIASSITAKEGKEFILYDVTIHNTTNEDYQYSQAYFSIVTGSGEIEDNYLILDFNDELDDLGTGELAPNGQRSGWVLFSIPQGDQPLEIRYEEISFSKPKSERTTFKIKLR